MNSIAEQKKRLQEKKSQIKYKEMILKEKEKKAETKNLIQIGSLVKKSGLHELDHTAILGALLEIFPKSKDEEQLKIWRENASKFLEKNSQVSRIILTFEKEIGEEEKSELKQMKFKWNPFRKEWYGSHNKEDIFSKFAKFNPILEEVE